MPPASDWRSASAAKKLLQLDRAQLAAEFLRRHPGYNEDYCNTQDQIASGSVTHEAGMERIARRWGLSFPACTRRPCVGIARHLATGAYAIRCYRCSRA
jgi:hypothetical protein